MNAQFYVGGSVGFQSWSSQKLAGDISETTYKILPEFGYNLSDDLAIGTVIGYESDKVNGVEGLSENAFTFNPYVRYSFVDFGKVKLFCDCGIDYTTASKADWTAVGIGFKPGVAINLTDKISFVSHLGFLGWQQFNPDGDDNNVSSVGLDLSGSELTFGLYFNF